jgi:hypothetical protein
MLEVEALWNNFDPTKLNRKSLSLTSVPRSSRMQDKRSQVPLSTVEGRKSKLGEERGRLAAGKLSLDDAMAGTESLRGSL